MTAKEQRLIVDRASADSHLAGGVWNGDYGQNTRAAKQSSVTMLADVVGERNGELLHLGAVMDLVDLCAGRAAYAYMEGPVVTVSVDRGILLAPLWQGDLVKVEARVVLVGASSLTVETITSREDLSQMHCAQGLDHDAVGQDGFDQGLVQQKPYPFQVCFSAQLTFVAIDKGSGRPYKNVPPLSTGDHNGSKSRAEHASKFKESLRSLDRQLKIADAQEPCDGNHLSCEYAQDAKHYKRTRWMALSDTECVLSKQYLPRHENFGGLVFGGDILMLLERAAIYCARRYCGAARVLCLALYGVHFKLPVQPTALLRTTARVVLVRRFCMEIEVKMQIDRSSEGLDEQLSHVAYFTVISYDGDKALLPVTVGLGKSDSDLDALLAKTKALLRLDTLQLVSEDEGLDGFLQKHNT